MDTYLLGIDVGTTNVKAALFNPKGDLLLHAMEGYPTYYPIPKSAEQDGNDWWNAVVNCLRQITSAMDNTKGSIAGIAISAQSPSLLPLDEKGDPLRRAMIWMDRRAVHEKNEIVEFFTPEGYAKAFQASPDEFYLAPKLLWLKKHEPDLLAKTKMIHMTNSYINFKLTGESALDYEQSVMLTHLVDSQTMQWSQQFSELLGQDISKILPRLCRCHETIGTVTAQAAAETGLAQGIPVMCGTTDGISAPLEMAMTKMGFSSEIMGTSSLIFLGAEKPASSSCTLMCIPQVFGYPEVDWIVGGNVNTSGASLKWYANVYKKELTIRGKEVGESNLFDVMNDLAQAAPAGSNKLLYFPYLMGERGPLWNSDLKGMFIGITPSTSHADITRSLMEGTSFAMRNVIEVAKADGIRTDILRVSGGGANSDIWMKIKASMLNCPVHVSRNSGGAARGDAMIAGYGAGLFSSLLEASEALYRVSFVVDPDPEWVKVYDDMYPIFISMRDHLLGDLAQLSAMSIPESTPT